MKPRLGRHPHTDAAFAAQRARLGQRAQRVLDYLRAHGPCTDRQVLVGLMRRDMNEVRPRITELVQLGLVHEVGTTTDALTAMTVRLVAAVPADPQGRLFAAPCGTGVSPVVNNLRHVQETHRA